MTDIAKRVIYIGRVQGVGFRFTIHRIARRYGLTGFVKNLPNGSVEMLAQGATKDTTDCMADIAESFGGYIRDTEITDVPLNPRYTDFNITF